MSVILFEDEKFQKLFSSIINYRNGYRGCGDTFANIFDYTKGWDSFDGMKPTINHFVNDLREANIQAWNNRYSERERHVSIEYRDCTISFRNHYELLKNLRSIRYNIYECEDNILINRLSQVIESVMMDIIDNIPEYENCEGW